MLHKVGRKADHVAALHLIAFHLTVTPLPHYKENPKKIPNKG